jgi:hypothetical protein
MLCMYIYTHIAIPIYTKLYYIRIIIRKEIVILSKKTITMSIMIIMIMIIIE